MSDVDVEGAIAYARWRMERELVPELTYHSLEHTFNDVLPAALRLADLSHVGEAEAPLIAVAAAYHDIGWVMQWHEHERAGANIARAILPTYRFNTSQIELIVGMIMATRLPQSPTNLLEEILADADLDVLGRDDFWTRNEDLSIERKLTGHPSTDEQWYATQLQFLNSHRYFTDAARLLRDGPKQGYMMEMKGRLARLRNERPV